MAKNRFFIFYLFLVIKEFLNFLVAYFLCQILQKKWKFSGFLNFKIYNLKIVLKTSGWF
jgi:hypothetical protein